MAREFSDPVEKVFEDFQQGDVVTTRRRTVEMSDILNFAALTGDFYPLHIDAVSCAEGRFKSRVAHGPLTFSLAVGLVGMTGYYGDAIVALKEISELRATAPVLPGDTLHVRAVVELADGSKSDKAGLIAVRYAVINQRDEQVMSFLQTMLAKKKTA
ncbi:MaoC/PaaZ C-terminal domain-containing protein [Oceanicola sp. 502str15]|uniref:MaoC/PaaZ C-terminal domain-containing protein n=1 Tax=Oceanicola sp. 502str15 TaxID=2696061 RepID=UPI002094336B|nr:MaoC/PaaZ C-terminal domain-containing protein [Oceanicola sp. 502str15]MCO6381745.1 dehydratase [Oceanicola sp. 502str15]